MKAELKDLIARYETRVKGLEQLITISPHSRIRLMTKRAVYMNVVRELKQLMKDESGK